ncbi:MAG TPA: family 20 glycosylhydrolase [Bryobacteraceae bacterium]|nr:family 20 glycosylhydrolase [Bryobacteraceae bacterium]
MMIRPLVVLLGAAMLQAQPNLMPWPAKITGGAGSLAIDQQFRVALSGHQEPRLRAAAARMIAHLSLKTGIPLAAELSADPSQATMEIHCERAGDLVQKLGEDESYRLEVTEKQAKLSAANPLGVLHGMETFLQLVEAGPKGFAAPAVVIEDKPRFPWRGLHMDVSRHWMPIEVVKRNLDGMAAVKLNVFHWHLSDDQGFRIESKRSPKLQGKGSDGHFYTQAQVREVIAYARDRGIRVVPEFDIPGHSTSWLVGYPLLASAPGPYQIERKWGVFDPTMDPTREATYQFLDSFIGEMAALFPDQFFHIGGDEVNGKQWNKSARVQAFRRQHHLKDNHELQAYFNKRIQAIVVKHGKRMEGWDEILNPDLPKDIVIQSWQGQDSLAKAARLGYSGLLSSGYYLDHIEPAAVLYMRDPMEKESASLTDDEKSRILGGEVCMWAEYVSAENVDSRIWPRTAAIAERFWSPQELKDVTSMYRRLEVVSRNLDFLGLTHNSNHHKMLERLAGSDPVEPLKTLADVLEPAPLDPRIRTHKYTQQYPLNRLVDAARPDSVVAREFASLVEMQDRVQIRARLTLWRDNDRRLRPILEKSALLAEDVPVSRDLSQLGSVGLQALDFIERKKRPPEAWVEEQRKYLDGAKKLRLELLIAIVPSIQKLVEQAAAGK